MEFTEEEREIIYHALKKELAERSSWATFLGRHIGIPLFARQELAQLDALALRFVPRMPR